MSKVTDAERITRLETLVVDLSAILAAVWGGEGCWQKCWDRPKELVKQITEEHLFENKESK